jgi:alkyldihydroxyacetonephosphate synthase
VSSPSAAAVTGLHRRFDRTVPDAEKAVYWGTMTSMNRRLGGWGFESECLPPSRQLLEWLTAHVGLALHPVPPTAADPPDVDAADLGDLPVQVSTDPVERLAHARGQGLVDVLRFRTGAVPALPDAVCRPGTADEVTAVLSVCADRSIRVIPWGGGTSVTGGVNVLKGDSPLLTLDLERLSGCTAVDHFSGLAVFGPGTRGPQVESALAGHGLTLGHYPQSWELATVGGWVATRSSGQESLGYGRIEDMVAGLEMRAPAGRFRLPAGPASAAGPDLRHLVMGSEGRFGVITEVTLRVRPRPQVTEVAGALLPDIERGLEVVRELVWRGTPLTMVRLSDAAESQVAMAVGLGRSRLAPLIDRYLAVRGIGGDGCLMLIGAAGDRDRVDDTLASALDVVGSGRGVSLGRRPGRHWLRDRFRHPYLRESLLDLGYATDTLETAAPWSAVAELRTRVTAALEGALNGDDERVAVLCHVSHPYRDGASLYFTFFFRAAADPEQTIARWARIKRAATEALIADGATLSHHHGIGQWHAPWLQREIGDDGAAALAAVAGRLDPAGILNPHVLLDPDDRLES